MSTGRDVVTIERSPQSPQSLECHRRTIGHTQWEKLWPVIACGAGLFSDGYLNGVSFISKSVTESRL